MFLSRCVLMLYCALFRVPECPWFHHHGEPVGDVQTVQRHSKSVEEQQDRTGQSAKSKVTSETLVSSRGPQLGCCTKSNLIGVPFNVMVHLGKRTMSSYDLVMT